MEELLNLLDELGGPSSMIAGVFEAMEIVEEEIDAGQQRYPIKEREIWNVFRLLGEEHQRLGTINSVLFRLHCRQLIDKIGHGDSLDEPTGIDLLLAFSEASLRTPLNATGERAYIQLWHKFVGDLPEVTDLIGDVSDTFDDLDYRLSARALQEEVDDAISYASRAIKRRMTRQKYFDDYLAENEPQPAPIQLPVQLDIMEMLA